MTKYLTKYLFYRQCIGIDSPDRLCHASELETLMAIQSHGDLNPVQSSRLKELQTSGDSGNPTGVESKGAFNSLGGAGGFGAPSFDSVMNNAKQLQQYQIQQNQPAIQSLGSQSSDLQKRYSDLLDSIKGQGTVAVNAQTTATNNQLGARGILPSSGLAQQTMANALLPVTAQTQGLLSQTGLAEQGDINQIASQIAQLQTGNVPLAYQTASQMGQMQQQASQFAQSQAQALQLAQQQLSEQAREANLANLYKSITPGASLYNTSTGQNITGQAASLTPLGAPTIIPPSPSSPSISLDSLWNSSQVGGIQGKKYGPGF